MSETAWLVEQSGFDVARANYYETLFTVGNGRLGTRGSLEEGHLGQLSGTFLGGVYDGHAEREAGATHLRQAGGGSREASMQNAATSTRTSGPEWAAPG